MLPASDLAQHLPQQRPALQLIRCPKPKPKTTVAPVRRFKRGEQTELSRGVHVWPIHPGVFLYQVVDRLGVLILAMELDGDLPGSGWHEDLCQVLELLDPCQILAMP